MKPNLRIVRLPGKQIAPYVEDVARLRITVFRDYPYLYDGSMAYEKKYLKRYLDCPDSVLVLAMDQTKVVGASTALPLSAEDEDMQKALAKTGEDISKIFYFGESILLPEYRGKGVGYLFFLERENAAREQGYGICAFCSVVRPANHPRKPEKWHSLEPFWKKLGYSKHPKITTKFSWKDLDDEEETEKPMVFWTKYL